MVNNCECLDCIKERSFAKYYGDRQAMVGDSFESDSNNLDGKADEFINGVLAALQPVQILSSPNGSLIKTVNTGDTVGVITSYVTRDGVVWWEVEYPVFGGKDASAIGYVKHAPGLFDENILKSSLAAYNAKRNAQINAAAQKRIDANTNPLYNFIPDMGSYLKYALIGFFVYLAILLATKLIKI